jgi:molecular chaperone DnaK (HSP70)
MNPIMIGIDLGTTNSEVALIENGKAHIIEVEEGSGSYQLPSYVGLDEQGDILIGNTAKNQYLLYPERTIKSIKRQMGEDIQVQLGENHYSPQEISALILRHLKQVAERYTGQSISHAVITVPAFFSDVQRQATRDAGEIAGLTVERILNEPTAAALAYEVNSAEARTILVYDLGGGTFDVSAVKMEDNVVEVLSSHGDNQLGGDDFDQKIIDHLLTHLRETQDIDATKYPKAMSRLVRAAENAKIALSSQPYFTVEEEHLLQHNDHPVHLSLELSRDDYEAMILPFIEQTMEAIHTALEGANLRVSDIDEILLVGGSTKTPLVRTQLEQNLGRPIRLDVDPDLCVAMGAAVQAGIISGETVSATLIDVTPYTFGSSGLDMMNGQEYPYVYVPIIKKNTPIPVTCSESFYAVFDGQKKIEISVYQGEDPDAINNERLGQFMIDDLKDVREGDAIIVTFALDINGILQVTSTEKKTGKQKSLTLDNAIGRFQTKELEQAREHVEALFNEDDSSVEKTNASTDLTTEYQALLAKAKQLQPRLEGEDKEDMLEIVTDLEAALVANDRVKAQELGSDLTDLIYYLET